MARSWQEIQALPEFQALDARRQEGLRNKYFRHVVAPQVPTEELDAARANFDAETAPPVRNESFAGDIPDLVQKGLYNAAGGVLDFVGADTPAEWLYDQAKAQEQTLTPETVQALEQPLFSEEGDYYLGEGFTSPRAWLAQGLETLGGMALPIPGGALARAALRPLLGMGKAAQAAKGALMAEGVAERQAGRMAQRLAPDWRDTAATVAGYGGMEGLVSGGLAEQQTREQVLAMPQAQLEQAPAYWEALQQAGGDPQAARQLLAENLGKEAGWKTFGPTVALGAGAGRYYDKLIGGGGTGSRLKNMLQGGATETLEEAPQSAAETLAQNTTLQQVDPTIGTTDNLIPNMLTGAALGGTTGGVIAGLMPKGTLARAADAGGQAEGAGLPAQPGPTPEEQARQQQEQARQQQEQARQQQAAAQAQAKQQQALAKQQQEAQRQQAEAQRQAVEQQQRDALAAQKAAQEAEKTRQAQLKTQKAAQDLANAGGVPPTGPTPGQADRMLMDEADDELARRYADQEAEAALMGVPTAPRAGAGEDSARAVVAAAGIGPAPGTDGATTGAGTPSAVAVPAVRPVRGDPRGPRPDEDVWADEPDLVDTVDQPDGTWHITRRPSKDGRWDLFTDVNPDGEEVNQEVWPRQAPGQDGGVVAPIATPPGPAPTETAPTAPPVQAPALPDVAPGATSPVTPSGASPAQPKADEPGSKAKPQPLAAEVWWDTLDSYDRSKLNPAVKSWKRFAELPDNERQAIGVLFGQAMQKRIDAKAKRQKQLTGAGITALPALRERERRVKEQIEQNLGSRDEGYTEAATLEAQDPAQAAAINAAVDRLFSLATAKGLGDIDGTVMRGQIAAGQVGLKPSAELGESLRKRYLKALRQAWFDQDFSTKEGLEKSTKLDEEYRRLTGKEDAMAALSRLREERDALRDQINDVLAEQYLFQQRGPQARKPLSPTTTENANGQEAMQGRGQAPDAGTPTALSGQAGTGVVKDDLTTSGAETGAGVVNQELTTEGAAVAGQPGAVTPGPAAGGPPADLVEVVDGYGNPYWVRQRDLDQPERALLPTYDRQGKAKDASKKLNRANIVADPQTVPRYRTRQALKQGGYQTRERVRTDEQEQALYGNGFRPVLLAEDGVWEFNPWEGIWAKPPKKQGAWGELRPARKGPEMPGQKGSPSEIPNNSPTAAETTPSADQTDATSPPEKPDTSPAALVAAEIEKTKQKVLRARREGKADREESLQRQLRAQRQHVFDAEEELATKGYVETTAEFFPGLPQRQQPAAAPANPPEKPDSSPDTEADAATREAERVRRMQSLEVGIRQTALADKAVRSAALGIARGDESLRPILRQSLVKALGAALGEEANRIVKETPDNAASIAALEELGTLMGNGADGLNPEVFTEEALSAWEAEALKQAQRALRAERKAAHEQTITAALTQAWRDSGFWQADPDDMVRDMEREFIVGWNHALEGGTGSNLPPGDKANDLRVRRLGYDAAVTWLGTEDGKAFVTGAKPRKMQGVGEQFRRRQDERKQRLAAIDLSQDEQAQAFVTALMVETERAELFPLPETGAGQATPGLRRYLMDLRNQLLPFMEWMASQGYGGRGRYTEPPREALEREAKRGQAQREELRAKAEYYIDQVTAFHQVFAEAKNLQDAAGALVKWAIKDDGKDPMPGGKIGVGQESRALRQFIGWPVTLGGEPGQRKPSITRKRGMHGTAMVESYLEGGWNWHKYSAKENEPDDTSRNQPLKRPRFDRVERAGLEDHRQGRNITAEELTSTFGLKGVTYGEGVTAKQRQDHTNYTYDAFMDLAKLLGIEPRHIGLGGKLTFAFGALGQGRHSAHYTPDHNGQGQAINLTNTRGDGAVAHEWAHALDWNLRQSLGGGAEGQAGAIKDMVALLSYSIPSGDAIANKTDQFLRGQRKWERQGRNATPEDHAALYLQRTINDLRSLIARGTSPDRWAGASQTRFKIDADGLGKDYWGNAAELFARAFESWAYDRLEGENNYLVSDWVEALKVMPPAYRGQPYPSGEERDFFNDAFDRLLKEIEWTDAGPALKGWNRIYEIVSPQGYVFNAASRREDAEEWMQRRQERDQRAGIATYEMFIRERTVSPGWEDSPLKAKARDAIERAEELRADLKTRAQELKDRIEAEKQAAAARAAAEAERLRQEEEARVRKEWEALQAQKPPTPEPAATGDGTLSLDELSALFDEAEAEIEEERQEAPRAPTADPAATPAAPPETGPAFVDDPNAPVIELARRLAARDWTTELTWRELGTLADQAFGGTKAEGKYTPKDAYDALEMALNLVISSRGPLQALFGKGVQTEVRRVLRADVAEALVGLAGLDQFDAKMPTQTNRTAEQDEFQQFSTPHAHAALMARVANLDYQDVILEPSAGSGNLVVMPALVGVERIHVNELAPRRAAILKALGFASISTENAEQLGNILGPKGLKPTVVIMNPPFSASAGRVAGQRDNRIGAQHVEEALKLLAPGGRAVILMGRGYTRGHARLNRHWAWLLKNYNVRANLGLDGSQYKKFGTSFDNRLVVIDKTGPTPNPDAILGGEGLTVAQALEQLENIRNDRIHVGGRYGSEPGGGQVAEAGSLPGGAVGAAPAATGAVGDGQSGAVGTLGAGTGGDGGGAAVPGAQRPQGTRRGGAQPGRGRRRSGGDPAGRPGADAGGRGGAGDGATVLPGGGTDSGLDAGVAASLSHAAAEFAKHGVEGINEALTGLAELFGGGNRLRSFPGGIDEETYAQAKPHFEKAAQAFLAAGNDFKEFFKVLIRAFGSGIKPYALRFAQEWQAREPAATPPADETPANEPPAPEPEPTDAPKALSDSIYEGYTPNPAWAGLGAKPHPGALVESAAMAAVKSPDLTVSLQFPREVYTEGRLSAAQLDAVAYTEQAHQRILPNGERQGFFIGDGTGVGKGREVAGIIYHNWLQGRRKALWLSVNNDLFKDSSDYLKAVAGAELGLFNLQKVQAEGQITAEEGVAFVTYPMLRSAGQGQKDATGKKVQEGQRRIDQLVAWLGPDFDGVIAFDESHNMGNALESRAARGTKKPSQVALLGVELQRRLPKARVVYVSATGATEPNNLGYLTRLGLWGAGTPFPDVKTFVNNVAGSGLAAMEVVAKDMKAMGIYLARSLPFHEVSYAQLEHALTADQREMYDTIAGAWQVVLSNINEALEGTQQQKDGKAKGAAMAQFWGAQQRFFNQMLTSLQMPSLITAIEADLAAGRAPILQFVNTNEASQERQAAKLAQEERDLEELDITPRQILLQYLENAFPVNQYEQYTDENGDKKVRPVTDSQGNPVQNLEAVAARDALMDRVAQLRFPDNPIDILVGHFGSNQVAEITGRKRRFVRDPKTGKVTEEKRNDALRAREVDEFQGDKRRLLIFSDKGGTGKSYHADLNVKNQRKRAHYLVQPGWRADKAIQGLGRSHRTNQAQAPHVVLVTTNLRGHRRFVASIARRMDQLGALTKGHRKTGGQGLFTEDMNLESQWADRALEVLIGDVLAGRVEGVTRDTLTMAMGLDLETKEGRQQKMSGLPTIQQFLNRILVLESEPQNQLFDAFAARLTTQLEQARENGTLDLGLENIIADRVRLVSDREVFTHPRTGATTRLVELELTNPVEHWTFDAFMEEMLARKHTPFFARNKRSGRVWGFTPGADMTAKNGEVKQTWRRWGTLAGRSSIDERWKIGDPAQLGRYPLNADAWEFLDLATASQAWAEQYATAPKEATETVHLLSGVLLPIWDRLTDAGQVRVQRALTDDGEMVLGRHIVNDMVDKILMRLTGSSRTAGMTPQAIFEAVLNRKATAVLANNWRLTPRRIANNPRIELTGQIMYREGQLLQEQGVIYERIGYEGRYFIPTDPVTGVEVLTRVMENRPVIELLGQDGNAADETRFSQGQAQGPRIGREEAVRRLGTALGSRVARVLLDSGIVTLTNAGGRYQGVTWRDGTLMLNLDALTAGNFEGVLLHEGFHSAVRELLGETKYQELMGQLDKLLASPAGWVKDAKAAVPADTAAVNVTEEVGAYAISQVLDEQPIPNLLRRWAEGFLSALRAAIIRRLPAGRMKNWALANLKPMDLARLARAGLRAKARGMRATQGRVAPAFSIAASGPSGKPKPSDVVLVDGKEEFGQIPSEIANEALSQTKEKITPAPIKLLYGEHKGPHRGYGLVHIEAEHGEEIRGLGSVPEDFVLTVLKEANQIWASGDRLVFAKTGRGAKAMVIELKKEEGYYTVITAYPVYNQFKTFGKPVWRGRAHDRFTGMRADGLYSQGAPLIDQQLINPPEPHGGNNTLRPLLDTLRGQPGNENIDPKDVAGNPDIRFSLAPDRDSGGSPLGGGKALLDSVKQAMADQWTGKLGTSLGALTLRQLADVGSKWLPGIKLYDRVRLKMETRRNVMMEESGRLGDAVDSWARHRAHREEARAVFELMNDATLQQVDPAEYQVLKIPLQLGPGFDMQRNWEATEANVQELRRRVRAWKKSSNVRERELAGYYQIAARKLALAVKAENKRRAAYPDLLKRWEALSSGKQHLGANGQPFASEQEARTAMVARRWPKGTAVIVEAVEGGWALQELGGQEVYLRFRDLYKKRSEEMLEALIKRLDSLESLDDVDKRALAAKIRAEFEAPIDEQGNPRIGPYFPLQRFGRFYVFARRFGPEGAQTFRRKDGEPFESAESARSALYKREDLKGVNARPVELEDGSGWVLEDQGEPGFWLHESVGERRQAVVELEAEGWQIVRQGLTAEAHRELQGVSESFVADAVDKLKKQGSKDEADALYQMYLQTLQQMSIRKKFIHRKGTKGYTSDQLRAYGWNMTRLAHQISKLEGLPGMEKLLRGMEEGLKAAVKETPGMDTTRQDALLEEMKKRHEYIANPDNAPWTNAVAALGFLFYLGVSPAAALVNLSQVPIVALPVLTARLRGWARAGGTTVAADGRARTTVESYGPGGAWGETSRALTTAFLDVARGFKPGVLKGFITGRPLPSEAANLSAEERAAFAEWDKTGARDRTQAHNLAGIGDADSWLNGPTFNRVMGAISSLFHLAEVANRDATLLAAYRLARSRGIGHEMAILQAEEATWEAHFDYSNANRARFMQGNVAKALLMFKNYAQHVLFFLGRNLYLWAMDQDPAVRQEARTKFAGMVGMTALFAGTAGLPIGGAFVVANLVQALFGDDDEPWDAETEWRKLLDNTFPRDVADIIDRGAVNKLTGMDFSSRVSLSDLIYRSPDRDLDGAGMFQHVTEQLLGPVGGIAARPFTMYDELAEGRWGRAAEAAAPKFLKDLGQMGRFTAEGVLTRKGDAIMAPGELSSYELFGKGLGFTPDDLRVKYERNQAIKLYEGRIEARRGTLILAAALAIMERDPEALRAARQKIAVYNLAVPQFPISEATIRRSVRTRQMMRERAEDGIIVNPKLAYLRDEVGFGREEEAGEE